MDREYILKHIEDFTAQQLFECISQGIVTIDELRGTGNLDASIRKAIIALQTARETEDDNAWNNARYTEQGCRDYLTKYPAGKHVAEAKQKIDEMEEQRNRNRAAKQGILNNIKKNPNSYNPTQILDFLNNGTITQSDLTGYCEIPQSAIDNLGNINTPTLTLGNTPSAIPPGYTEVYFWGGRGSGKTCALGAILQMSEKMGYLDIATGSGYNYAYQLKNIFSDDGHANDYLPAPTPTESNQYLPFTLKKENEKHSRSISLIELSGEIFECFFYHNAGQQMPSQSHLDSFNSLKNFLNSNNHKIHFFFIDYDKENKPNDRGLKQSDYLAAASTYFKNNTVFGKSTAAIYVVLTKSDLLTDDNGNKLPVHERVEFAKKHLNENNYKAFINTLKDNCKTYNINAGRLTVEPFSLGKVYFREICNFEGSAAENIVEILMDRIAPDKKSILDVFNK